MIPGMDRQVFTLRTGKPTVNVSTQAIDGQIAMATLPLDLDSLLSELAE